MKFWSVESDEQDNYVLQLDLGPDAKQNVLKTEVFEELDDFLSKEYPRSLVITSAKPNSFCAGADIEEIRALLNLPPEERYEKAMELTKRAEEILLKLYNANYPVVAAIAGECLGGGLELAMACHERIAAYSPKTRFGLPETSLGIIPGFGGTQTLPRLVGTKKALEIILGGAFKKLSAEEALRCGLISELVEPGKLLDEARRLAEEMAATGITNGKHRHKVGIEKLPLIGRCLILSTAKKRVLKESKGAYPAILKAVEAVADSSHGDIRAGLEKEHRLFAECANSPEAKSLVDIFFLTKEARSKKWVDAPLQSPPKRLGVVGAGFMGCRIASEALTANIPVQLHDTYAECVHDAVKFIEAAIGKEVYKKKLTMEQAQQRRNLLSVSFGKSLRQFERCDFVVEAIKEDLVEKQNLIAQLAAVLSVDTIIATNTSSLIPSDIAALLGRQNRFCAVHFFSKPGGLMDLVEIAGIKHTAPETIAKALALTKALNKTPVVLDKECAGLVVNRVLVRGLANALAIAAELGVDPWAMDDILERYGFAMGPFKTADLVGFGTAQHVTNIMAAYYPTSYPKAFKDSKLKLDKFSDLLGQKTGKGFYCWDGTKVIGPNRAIEKRFGWQFEHNDPLLMEGIRISIVTHMKLEAQDIAKAGILEPNMIDLALILGAGICPNRRGLLSQNS